MNGLATGDIVTAYSADSNQVYEGWISTNAARKMTGHVGLYDKRRDHGNVNDTCILWWDDVKVTDKIGRSVYAGRWVSPKYIRSKYDSVIVMRYNSWTRAKGEAAVEWAKRHVWQPNGYYCGTEPKMVTGSWYRETAMREVLGNLSNTIRHKIESWFGVDSQSKDYLVKLSGKAWLGRLNSLVGFADDSSWVIKNASGNFDHVRLGADKSKDACWYGGKMVVHAWAASTGDRTSEPAGFGDEGDQIVLPVDLVGESCKLHVTQWWR